MYTHLPCLLRCQEHHTFDVWGFSKYPNYHKKHFWCFSIMNQLTNRFQVSISNFGRKMFELRKPPPKVNRWAWNFFLPSSYHISIRIFWPNIAIGPHSKVLLVLNLIDFNIHPVQLLVEVVELQVLPQWSDRAHKFFSPQARMDLSGFFDRILLSVLIQKFF